MTTTGKLMAGLALMAGSALVLSGPAWSDGKDKKKDETKEAVEMSKTAKVTIEQAIKTAQEKVPGKVIEAELEREHDRAVWEVEIAGADDKVTEVHIDADSGAVIDTEAKGEEKKESKGKGKGKRKQDYAVRPARASPAPAKPSSQHAPSARPAPSRQDQNPPPRCQGNRPAPARSGNHRLHGRPIRLVRI
ncbi:MAG: PepSY domain-containing protein, partial [Nitrospiraceae bacterium]